MEGSVGNLYGRSAGPLPCPEGRPEAGATKFAKDFAKDAKEPR